jgi:DNA-binding GntR family transcriptional regulator
LEGGTALVSAIRYPAGSCISVELSGPTGKNRRTEGLGMANTAGSSSNADRAYAEIKRAVIQGALPPGAAVSEHELAGKLGMSRTPVHQALDRLRHDGWVTIAPRAGVRVAGIEPADMRDIYEALSALEGSAALRFATAHASAGPQGDEALERLEHAALACERALAEGDLNAWAEADNSFHSLLVVECGNQQLVRLSQSVMEHAHRARLLTVQLRSWPESYNKDHREILRHIAEGNPEAARTALYEHRQRGINTLIPILEKLFSTTPSFLTR